MSLSDFSRESRYSVNFAAGPAVPNAFTVPPARTAAAPLSPRAGSATTRAATAAARNRTIRFMSRVSFSPVSLSLLERASRAERFALRSIFEHALEPLEVLAELLLRTARHDPRREAGEHAGVAFPRHRQARAAAARLELVPHRERDRAVERAQREEARGVLCLDLERRLQLAAEHVPRLADLRALAHRRMHSRLPLRQVGHVGEIRPDLFGRPGD